MICITQAVGTVEKQFRALAQDFTYLRNLSKEKYGVLRCPGLFVRKTFLSVPGPTSKPMDSGTFKLDVAGCASCYNSAQGVGIHGRGADMGARQKGYHWAWGLLGLAVVLVVLFGAVPKVIARMFGSTYKLPPAHALVS